jgi:hypothetical protein
MTVLHDSPSIADDITTSYGLIQRDVVEMVAYPAWAEVSQPDVPTDEPSQP